MQRQPSLLRVRCRGPSDCQALSPPLRPDAHGASPGVPSRRWPATAVGTEEKGLAATADVAQHCGPRVPACPTDNCGPPPPRWRCQAARQPVARQPSLAFQLVLNIPLAVNSPLQSRGAASTSLYNLTPGCTMHAQIFRLRWRRRRSRSDPAGDSTALMSSKFLNKMMSTTWLAFGRKCTMHQASCN